MNENCDGVEQFLRYLILHGASEVAVDLDGKRIERIRYRHPGGPERSIEFAGGPLVPGPLQIIRGGKS